MRKYMPKKVMGTPGPMVDRPTATKLLGISSRSLDNLIAKGLLRPVFDKRKAQFREEEVLALKEVLKGGLTLPNIASTALQALAKAERCERKLAEVLDLLGLMRAHLPTDKRAVEHFFLEAGRLRFIELPLTEPTAVYNFSKQVLGITEEYLQLVEQYTGEPEPWRVFLESTQKLRELTPHQRFVHDHELSSAYGFLEAARRHIRALAYFYVRKANGKGTADAAFFGDGAFDPLITTLFPN